MKGRRLAYTLFDSKVGRCGIAWSERGVVRIHLPESTDEQTTRRLAMSDTIERGDPPPPVAQAIVAICRHLDGDPQSFSEVPLDTSGLGDFSMRVYAGARKIEPGTTLSYGELALRIRSPGAARAVGQALGKNPFPIVVPCHRILAANGRPGGFSAPGGLSTKARILAIEGVTLEASSSPRVARSTRAV